MYLFSHSSAHTYRERKIKRETCNFLPGIFTSLSVRPAALRFSHSFGRLSCPRYSWTWCLSSQANTGEEKKVYTHIFLLLWLIMGYLSSSAYTSLSCEVARPSQFNYHSFILTSITGAGHGAELRSHWVSWIISSSTGLRNLQNRKEMEHRSGNSALSLVCP